MHFFLFVQNDHLYGLLMDPCVHAAVVSFFVFNFIEHFTDWKLIMRNKAVVQILKFMTIAYNC
jgi:hypothetical protein